ncbi:MAG: response regulator [Nitrososphaera sp.]|uniref:response regulator n=1 Tax=Candidatus Nitrososphaera gargensis TaxID=497727 RepID=UPI00164FEC85|nr:response regulator [Candidatus Nitrososphaera gargensis]
MSRAQSILVVDDELDIVTIFRQALSRYGYSVFGFTDPTLALEHFRLNAQDYALVISDVRMPQMSGFELAANIKAIKPDARIVLMSAFEVSDLEFSTSAVKTSDFLRKPVDIRTLVQKVKGAMAN